MFMYLRLDFLDCFETGACCYEIMVYYYHTIPRIGTWKVNKALIYIRWLHDVQ